MNDSNSAKQQIIDRIKNSTTILVTVSRDPSVDQLSAALALTSFLNKLKKHTTAVVSGQLPQAMKFLEPDKTFESTVDSLRDFIIELNKEKADHLRYKVEGDVVKIFITPYRTTITSDDLDFSQGDYNVELILALGVTSADHLDTALDAHGRILHDATVATLTIGQETSNLGSIDWHDKNASSVSELTVGLLESLKDGDTKIDDQTATALLTGIVAATDRFSNERTSSRVMTIAAQLMAAGANQQLIAARLEEASAISTPGVPNSNNSGSQSTDGSSSNEGNRDGTTYMQEGESTKLSQVEASQKSNRNRNRNRKKKQNDGELNISHEKRGDLDEVGRQVTDERQADAARAAEDRLEEQMRMSTPAANAPSLSDLQNDIQAANNNAEASADAVDRALAANETITNSAAQSPLQPELPPLPPQPAPVAIPAPQAPTAAPVAEIPPMPSPLSQADQAAPGGQEPTLGGTLNATTEQAAEDKRREEAKDRNKKILSHGSYLGSSKPTYDSPINSASGDNEGSVDPFGGGSDDRPQQQGFGLPTTAPTAKSTAAVEPLNPAPYSSGPTLAEIDAQNRAAVQAATPQPDANPEPQAELHDEARAEVEAAFNSASEGLSFEEAPAPQFAPEPISQPAPAPEQVPQFEPASAPEMPPMPDFSTLPALPTAPQEAPAPQSAPAADPFMQMPPLPGVSDIQPPSAPQDQPAQPAPQPQAPSPTQFRIPGQ